MLFTLKPHNLITHDNVFVTSFKFLGVYINNQLNWHSHFDDVSTRLSCVIYLISHLQTVKLLRVICQAHILPIFNQ